MHASDAVDWLVRWPAGTAIALGRWILRPVPLHTVDEAVSDVVVPELPEPVAADPEIQRAEDGVGPLFHRRYRVRIRYSPLTAAELMSRIVAGLDALVPWEAATVEKERGAAEPISVGDDYVIRLPGPWDGPVRVIRRTPTGFRLATRTGHVEAGQIDFRTGRIGEDLGFEIESWARSGDRAAHLFYDRMQVSMAMQMYVWTTFCHRVVDLADGRLVCCVQVWTQRAAAQGRAAVG